jgi:hypothetical protein
MAYTIFEGNQKWPFAKVPYVVDGFGFPPGSPELASIDAAVAAWIAGSAVVQISPRQDEADYVQFVPNEAKTASFVGRQGGRQDISAAHFPAIPATASLAAINQVAGQVDCVCVDSAGAVRVSWMVGNGTWNSPEGLTLPDVATGARVTVGRQRSDQIDGLRRWWERGFLRTRPGALIPLHRPGRTPTTA